MRSGFRVRVCLFDELKVSKSVSINGYLLEF